MFIQDKLDSHTTASLQPGSSVRDVTYSCGACGYVLNLSSSNRNTTNITSKYAKSIKKGAVSFYSIDETRFVRAEELRCRPYFNSAGSWGLFRRRTRLLCRKCGARIGYGSASPAGSGSIDWNGVAGDSKYEIRIAALQPSEDDASDHGKRVAGFNFAAEVADDGFEAFDVFKDKSA